MNPVLAGYVWCAVAGVCGGLATLMIKFYSDPAGVLNLSKWLWLGTGGLFYFLGFCAYSQALAKMQLTVAYPVMTAVTLLFVGLVGWLALGEPMGASKVSGMVLAGVACVLLTR